MKATVLLPLALLLAACDKAEEKPAATPGKPAASANDDSKRMVPTGRKTVVAAAAGQPGAPPEVSTVAEEEIKDYSAQADQLLAEWEAYRQLPAEQQTKEGINAIREKHMKLVAARGKLIRGMTIEQRKQHMPAILGPITKVGSGLTTWQLTRGRKNLLPPSVRPPEAPGEQGADVPAPPPGTGPVPEVAQPAPGLGEGNPDPADPPQ